ncbi:glycosyltransferase [Chloroflexota bacterium]
MDETITQGVSSQNTVELPLPDGTMYSKSKGVCPTGPPFSFSPVEDYISIVGEEKIERLLAAVERVKGVKILELNSTPIGGGVAEMLLSSAPFVNHLGIDAEWKVIRGSKPFYEVTKCIHNLLQGRGGCFTSEMEKIYFETIEDNSNGHIVDFDADLVIVHDPQPLGLSPNLRQRGNRKSKWLWRCHIDMDEETLKANSALEHFINYWVEPLDGAIFSAAQYIICRWPFPKFIIPPFIDPLSPKNRELSESEIQDVLEKHGIDTKLPIIAQIGRFDPWKGIDAVVDVYREVKSKIKCQLILAGGIAADDPEGDIILSKVRQMVNGDPNVHILCLPPTSSLEINALQRASQVILQLSTKEGFGLTVTEALWKGKPVIASPVGGITQQLRDGESGFFHYDTTETAENVFYLLEHPRAAELMGKRGQSYVKEHFLLPDRLADYFKAINMICGSALDTESIISFHSWHKLDKRK